MSKETHPQHKTNILTDQEMTIGETPPPISLLKQPMRSLDSFNVCLCLLVLTAEPHFDLLLTKNGLGLLCHVPN